MLNVDSGRACFVVAQQLATVQPTVALPWLDSLQVVALGPTVAHGMPWKHWYKPNAFVLCQALLSAIYQPSFCHVSSVREVLIACN